MALSCDWSWINGTATLLRVVLDGEEIPLKRVVPDPERMFVVMILTEDVTKEQGELFGESRRRTTADR